MKLGVNLARNWAVSDNGHSCRCQRLPVPLESLLVPPLLTLGFSDSSSLESAWVFPRIQLLQGSPPVEREGAFYNLPIKSPSFTGPVTLGCDLPSVSPRAQPFSHCPCSFSATTFSIYFLEALALVYRLSVFILRWNGKAGGGWSKRNPVPQQT